MVAVAHEDDRVQGVLRAPPRQHPALVAGALDRVGDALGRIHAQCAQLGQGFVGLVAPGYAAPREFGTDPAGGLREHRDTLRHSPVHEVGSLERAGAAGIDRQHDGIGRLLRVAGHEQRAGGAQHAFARRGKQASDKARDQAQGQREGKPGQRHRKTRRDAKHASWLRFERRPAPAPALPPGFDRRASRRRQAVAGQETEARREHAAGDRKGIILHGFVASFRLLPRPCGVRCCARAPRVQPPRPAAGLRTRSSSMKISVCIATYRRPERLSVLLDDLARQERVPDEVVVVDNDASGSAREPSSANATRA